jgi:hypothetical protein
MPPPPKASDLVVDPWFLMSKSIWDGIGYGLKRTRLTLKSNFAKTVIDTLMQRQLICQWQQNY